MDALWTGGFAGLWLSQSEHPVSETHGRAIGREHFGFSYAGYACRVHPPWRNLRTLRSYDRICGSRKKNDPKKDCLKLITARKWEKKLWANVKKTASLSASPLPRSHCTWGAAASGARCIMAQLFYCNPSLPWVTSFTTLASEFFCRAHLLICWFWVLPGTASHSMAVFNLPTCGVSMNRPVPSSV